MSITVSDLLQIKGKKVETAAQAETILDAVKHMGDHHIGCLVVVNKTAKLIGILSERDCMWKVFAAGGSPRTKLVKDVMTPVADMKTVTPKQTVEECMELMTKGRHRHLPVLEDGKLAGLVSIGDVVRSTIESKEATIKSLEKYITGSM